MPTSPASEPISRPARSRWLRCVECASALDDRGSRLVCEGCGAVYPIERGTPRLLSGRLAAGSADPEIEVKRRTAASFGYEWEAFGTPREQWRRNFIDYMQPHPPQFFDGIDLLDVGTGSGRHANEAAKLGARVVAVDIGSSIDIARSNLPPTVATVQADAEALPFPPSSFDFVMAIGVLHHLPSTERALRRLVPFVRPGGHVHIYLYWQPRSRFHRLLLGAVGLARRVTTRLPHRILHAACYPLAAVLFAAAVGPYRMLRRSPRLKRLADAFPLKAYADYPFGVLVNDQFDRFSAPIERRFTREQAEELMRGAGLVDVVVIPNNGWVCDGRRPPAASVGVREEPRKVRLRATAAQGPMMPGFRIRVLQLGEELARHGISIDSKPLFSAPEEARFRAGTLRERALIATGARRRLLAELKHDQAEVTLIQRQVDMLPSLRVERIAAGDGPLIWDVDDAIWHDTSREARQHPLAVLKGTRRKVEWLAKRADHIVAGNRILAEWLAARNERVTVIPSVVETRGVAVKEHSDQETVTLGWIGSPPTARYLTRLRSVLAALRGRLGGRRIRLLLVGGGVEAFEGIDVEERAWSPEGERRALSEMDIGLMPLPDTPWTRGKCSYKALQYMAGGIPAVADAVGIAAEVIGDGGRVVRSESEWAEAISALALDPGLRQRTGAAARHRVERDYSVRRWAPVLAEIVLSPGRTSDI